MAKQRQANAREYKRGEEVKKDRSSMTTAERDGRGMIKSWPTVWRGLG